MAVCAPQLALALLLPALCSAQFVVRIGYTSFEEPIAPVCPGLSQGQCDATFDGSAADCALAAGCNMPNIGIDSHPQYDALVTAGTVDGQARYVTNYAAGTNGQAELGFQTYYMACGADSLPFVSRINRRAPRPARRGARCSRKPRSRSTPPRSQIFPAPLPLARRSARRAGAERRVRRRSKYSNKKGRRPYI